MQNKDPTSPITKMKERDTHTFCCTLTHNIHHLTIYYQINFKTIFSFSNETGWTAGQKRTKVGTSIAGSEIEMAPDFECPEEFGYYPAPNDCTR